MGGPEMMAAQMAMQVIQGGIERGNMRSEANAIDENARIEETQGAYDAVQALRESRMAQGADLTNAAASGVGMGGSIADIMAQQAIERQYEAMSIHATAAMRARGLRSEAKSRRRQGDAALFGGVMRAGATAITSMGQSRANARLDAATARSQRQALGTIPIPSSSLVDRNPNRTLADAMREFGIR